MNLTTHLGKLTEYKHQYDNSLLTRIPRSLGRNAIKMFRGFPWKGIDFWNCYELSWLDSTGKPHVGILEFAVPADSEFLIESKSLKLYLNSLNNTNFYSIDHVREIIEKDLSTTVQLRIKITLTKLSEYNQQITQFTGINIDNLNIKITDYQINSGVLQLDEGGEYVEEQIFSDLLRSNCLITKQPDWASVQITYRGKKFNHQSLLQYIISFRNHHAFHEQCVEHMFYDIMNICKPESLTIFAKYTRRGGIDINPLRTTEKTIALEDYKRRNIRQ